LKDIARFVGERTGCLGTPFAEKIGAACLSSAITLRLEP